MTIYARPWGSLACDWGQDPTTQDRHFKWSSTMYLPVPGFEPMSSVFLGECVTD